MSKEILIHENQSSIFDLVDNTTTNTQTVIIKSKPPYHKDLFPNVRIIPLTYRCSLALNLCGESCYLLDFIYSLSPTSFMVYSSATEDIVKVSSNTIPNTYQQKHYLCEDLASIHNINYEDFYLEKLNNFRKLNDFDSIFDILSKL